MSASWMPELLEQSHCPPIPLDGHPLLTQEVQLPKGHVETRHYRPSNLHAWLLWRVCLSRRLQPARSRTHEHQSETILDWLLWIPLEQICRVLSEKTPQSFWGREPYFRQVLIALVWEWVLRTVHYNISSDLHSVRSQALEIRSSYWPTHQSTAPQFSVGTASPTKIDSSVGSPSSPKSFIPPSVYGQCEW